MTSSKGWGDRVETIDPGLRRETGKHVLATLVLLFVLAAVIALLTWLIRGMGSPDSEAIAAARTQLQRAAAAKEGSDRLQAARNAEQLLREQRSEGSTANLFLAAALAVQQAEDRHAPASFDVQIDDRLAAIHPGECAVADLTLAAELFYQSGSLHQADWIIGCAMAPSLEQTLEDRKAALKTASQIRFDLGDEDRVLEHCRELADLAPDDPFPWEIIAYIYENQNAPEAIIEAYEKLLEFESDSPDLRRKLAERLIEVGNAREAREQVAWLQTHAPGALEEDATLEGELLLLEGRPEEAEQLADRRLKETPDAVDAIVLKARVLVSRQEYADAIDLLKGAVESDPIHAQAHYLLGISYARTGERELAQTHLDRQRTLLNTMVELHRLQRLAGRDPQDVKVRLEIARLYEQLEDWENARLWRQAAAAAHQTSGN